LNGLNKKKRRREGEEEKKRKRIVAFHHLIFSLSLGSFAVTAGDDIYIRMGMNYDGAGGTVTCTPIITYTNFNSNLKVGEEEKRRGKRKEKGRGGEKKEKGRGRREGRRGRRGREDKGRRWGVLLLLTHMNKPRMQMACLLVIFFLRYWFCWFYLFIYVCCFVLFCFFSLFFDYCKFLQPYGRHELMGTALYCLHNCIQWFLFCYQLFPQDWNHY
jgi:hypothetical protein